MYMGVSKKRGTPKSSIFIGFFPIIFTVHFGGVNPLFFGQGSKLSPDVRFLWVACHKKQPQRHGFLDENWPKKWTFWKFVDLMFHQKNKSGHLFMEMISERETCLTLLVVSFFCGACFFFWKSLQVLSTANHFATPLVLWKEVRAW